jgi:hypothetical protein
VSEDYWVPIIIWLACIALPILAVAAGITLHQRRVFRDSLVSMELELKWMMEGTADESGD